MKELSTPTGLLIFLTIHYLLQGIQSMHSENMMQVGSDAWMYCHGLPLAVYMRVCSCMVNYKEMLAEKYGIDAKKRFTHSNVIGDIMYTEADCEFNLWLLDNKNSKRRKKRKFLEQPVKQKWIMPIKYEFHDNLSEADRFMIRAAMDHWGSETCVRFQPFDSSTHGQTADRLMFTNKPDGCYSFIGRQNKNLMPQQLNLQSNSCTGWIGVVIHEIGHALGLFHEQNRLDREFWVRFYAENVDPQVIGNFDLDPYAKTFNVPYDYGSIMQYDSRAFSHVGGVVLEPILPYSEYTMGQRGHLSYLDAKIMNIGYCKDMCNDFPMLPCKYGGYPDPNDCTKCRCPEGFGGQLCETSAPSDPECFPAQPLIEAIDQIQCLKSPGFDDPGFYPHPSKCNWLIQAPMGRKIRARFDGEFGVYCSGGAKRGPMCFHWVEVKHKIDKETRGGRFCCYDRTQFRWNDPGVIVSENNIMVVHFDATWPQTSNVYTFAPSTQARRGFRICFALDSAESDSSESESSVLVNKTSDNDDDGENQWWGPSYVVPPPTTDTTVPSTASLPITTISTTTAILIYYTLEVFLSRTTFLFTL